MKLSGIPTFIILIVLATLSLRTFAQPAPVEEQVKRPPKVIGEPAEPGVKPRVVLTRPVSDAKGVLAVFVSFSRGFGGRQASEELIFAAWPNGNVIWSNNDVQGGPPYHAGRIDPKKFDETLTRLDTDGIFANEKLKQSKIGPDSSYVTILVRSGEHELQMRSWHELSESFSDKLVATAGGIQALNGKTRLEELSQQPADYLFYRTVWSDLRRKLAALIPAESKPITGELAMIAGKVVWHDLAPAEK